MGLGVWQMPSGAWNEGVRRLKDGVQCTTQRSRTWSASQGVTRAAERWCDEVLRAVGTRLKSLASEQVAVCHFVSDEFVVIQQGGDGSRAVRLAESIRLLLTLPFEGTGYRVLLTATIGISYAPAHGQI